MEIGLRGPRERLSDSRATPAREVGGVSRKMGARINHTPEGEPPGRGPRRQEETEDGTEPHLRRPASPGAPTRSKPLRRVRPGGRSQLENAPSNIGNTRVRRKGQIGGGLIKSENRHRPQRHRAHSVKICCTQPNDRFPLTLHDHFFEFLPASQSWISNSSHTPGLFESKANAGRDIRRGVSMSTGAGLRGAATPAKSVHKFFRFSLQNGGGGHC